MEISLEGKNAVITGAAKGIGRGIAVEMSKAGAKVLIADKDEAYAKETEQLIRDGGGDAFIVVADITVEADRAKILETALKKWPQIDILVNNAGISSPGSLLDMPDELVREVFETNFMSAYFLTKAVSREMVKHKTLGAILFTSSVHTSVTRMIPAYSASKAALEMLVKEAALELVGHGIRVNAIAPGAIAISGEADRSSKHIPAGYIGTPEDVANAAIFLASDKASYITGQTLVVDGAFSLAHTHYWIKRGEI